MTDDALATTSPPVYELGVEASGLDLEVRFNDVPVMRIGGGHVETSFDVNPHVVTGMNHLGAIVRPTRSAGEYPVGARAQIVLRVRGAQDGDLPEQRAMLVFEAPELERERPFSGSKTHEGAEPIVLVSRGDVVQARIPVNLLTPFAPWSWLDGDLLSDTPIVFDELLVETRALWDLIQAKDVAALEAACAEQARDWKTAYYLPDDATAQRMLGVAQTLGDPDVQPAPFPDPHQLRLQLVGFGKLAHLIDAEGKGPISLGVKGVPQMKGRFTALFCRRGGEWVMIR